MPTDKGDFCSILWLKTKEKDKRTKEICLQWELIGLVLCVDLWNKVTTELLGHEYASGIRTSAPLEISSLPI
jgi:hypothetical protein